nr:hypothetical protein [Tanacetum cinerariifolium]
YSLSKGETSICCVKYDHIGMARAEGAAIKSKNGFDAFHIAAKLDLVSWSY